MELSIKKGGIVTPEGIHVAQADFTCWQYGFKEENYTYKITPSFHRYPSNLQGGITNGTTLYGSLSFVDGVVIGNNPFVANSSYSCNGYHISGTHYVGCYSIGTDIYWCYIDGKYENIISPHATYYGHAYSADPNKYPADGVGEDGIYYLKKTGNSFDVSYW